MTSAPVACLLIKWREVAALSRGNCHSPRGGIFCDFLKNNRQKICIIQKIVVPLHQGCKTDEKVANFESAKQLLRTKENEQRTRLKSYFLNHLSYVKNHL